MILETVSILGASALLIKATLAKQGASNDSDKIQRVFRVTGLNVKDGDVTDTAQLVKRKHHSWGVEYKYRIPIGREFSEYQAKHGVLQDGLNNRRIKVNVKDFKDIKLDKNIISSIRSIADKKLGDRKEVELSFDGFLLIRVYEKALPTLVPFSASTNWKVNIGQTRKKDEMITHNFERFPHMAIAGATTYGKSNLINCIINSLLLQNPNHVRFHLIDLKGGIELSDYENIDQTASIAYEPEQALITLKRAYDSMVGVQQQLKGMNRKKVQDAGIEKRHFVIIDEVGELNPSEATSKEDKAIKQQCQMYMSKLGRLGASLGFRVIACTQYPVADVFPRGLKQQCDARICFKVKDNTASRVVLDSGGGENLPTVKGRAIYQTGSEDIILQTMYIKPSDILDNIAPHIVEKEVIEDVETETRKDIAEFSPSRLS